MVNHIKKGDAVKLTEPLHAYQESDANNPKSKHWVTDREWMNTTIKQPYKLFDCIVGVYVGTSYVPTSRKGKIVQKLLHSFFFGGQMVYIDPKFVEIVGFIDGAVVDGKDKIEKVGV